MTVAISLSAYVMIVLLFGPKLYIILFHPERNVRASMMAPSQRQTNISIGMTKMEMGNCGSGGGGNNKNGQCCVDKATQIEQQQGQQEVQVQIQPASCNKKPLQIHPVTNQTTQTDDISNLTLAMVAPSSGGGLVHRFSFKKERVAIEMQGQSGNDDDDNIRIHGYGEEVIL
jgi:hypothetical protein